MILEIDGSEKEPTIDGKDKTLNPLFRMSFEGKTPAGYLNEVEENTVETIEKLKEELESLDNSEKREQTLYPELKAEELLRLATLVGAVFGNHVSPIDKSGITKYVNKKEASHGIANNYSGKENDLFMSLRINEWLKMWMQRDLDTKPTDKERNLLYIKLAYGQKNFFNVEEMRSVAELVSVLYSTRLDKKSGEAFWMQLLTARDMRSGLNKSERGEQWSHPILGSEKHRKKLLATKERLKVVIASGEVEVSEYSRFWSIDPREELKIVEEGLADDFSNSYFEEQRRRESFLEKYGLEDPFSKELFFDFLEEEQEAQSYPVYSGEAFDMAEGIFDEVKIFSLEKLVKKLESRLGRPRLSSVATTLSGAKNGPDVNEQRDLSMLIEACYSRILQLENRTYEPDGLLSYMLKEALEQYPKPMDLQREYDKNTARREKTLLAFIEENKSRLEELMSIDKNNETAVKDFFEKEKEELKKVL